MEKGRSLRSSLQFTLNQLTPTHMSQNTFFHKVSRLVFFFFLYRKAMSVYEWCDISPSIIYLACATGSRSQQNLRCVMMLGFIYESFNEDVCKCFCNNKEKFSLIKVSLILFFVTWVLINTDHQPSMFMVQLQYIEPRPQNNWLMLKWQFKDEKAPPNCDMC